MSVFLKSVFVKQQLEISYENSPTAEVAPMNAQVFPEI